jgi:hypothetical protein
MVFEPIDQEEAKMSISSHRPFDPPMTDSPDTMVLCDGGPHNGKLIKARMLANLSDGKYRKDPACTWNDRTSGLKYPVYRWNPKHDSNKQNGSLGKPGQSGKG